MRRDLCHHVKDCVHKRGLARPGGSNRQNVLFRRNGGAVSIVALCWFGMWMGISAKNANTATLLTLLFVEVIPWMVIGIASLTLSGLVLLPFFSGAGMSGMSFNYQLAKTLIAGVLCLIKDFGFIVLSRKKLYSSFRASPERHQSARTRHPATHFGSAGNPGARKLNLKQVTKSTVLLLPWTVENTDLTHFTYL